MKNKKCNSLLTNLYNTHSSHIINIENNEYLKLFEKFNDLIFNIEDENLRNRIMYSHIMIEKFLFNTISSTSKEFYEFAFNDLRELILTTPKID